MKISFLEEVDPGFPLNNKTGVKNLKLEFKNVVRFIVLVKLGNIVRGHDNLFNRVSVILGLWGKLVKEFLEEKVPVDGWVLFVGDFDEVDEPGF